MAAQCSDRGAVRPRENMGFGDQGACSCLEGAYAAKGKSGSHGRAAMQRASAQRHPAAAVRQRESGASRGELLARAGEWSKARWLQLGTSSGQDAPRDRAAVIEFALYLGHGPFYKRAMSQRKRSHRTQAQRRAEARERLLEATIQCLYELGYRKTSTTEVARRAGLSHGGRLHHFPTKTLLVATAVEHLIHRRRDDLVRAVASLPVGTDPIEAALDVLWKLFQGPEFFAWLELAVAARTDPGLRSVVRDLSRRFADTIEATFLELFPPPAVPEALYRAIPSFVVALFQGLAIDREVLGDEKRTEAVLLLIKDVARSLAPRFLAHVDAIPRADEPTRSQPRASAVRRD